MSDLKRAVLDEADVTRYHSDPTPLIDVLVVVVAEAPKVLDSLCRCCVRLNPQHGDGYADRTCRCEDTEPLREAIAEVERLKEAS